MPVESRPKIQRLVTPYLQGQRTNYACYKSGVRDQGLGIEFIEFVEFIEFTEQGLEIRDS